MKKTIAIILSIMLVLAITLPAAAVSTTAVKSINLNYSKITLKVGQTSNLKVTFTPANTTQKLLTYVTDNKNIATIDKDGKITGVSAGTTAITVYTLDKNIFKKCTVTISQPGSSSLGTTKPTTIRFAWWGGDARHKATFAALRMFSKKYSNIKVNVEYQGYDGYHEKMFTQLAGGTAPDLFQFNPENLPDIISSNKLENLDSYVKNGQLNLSDVSDASLFDGKYNGKLYGIPMSTQTFCVMYNKTLFDKAKVAYPKDTWTWEDYDKIVKDLHKGLPEGVYASNDFRMVDLTTLLMIHQKGGAYLTNDGKLNFKDSIAWPLQTFQNYMKAGIVPPIEETTANSVDKLFMEGKAAMDATYNAMAATLQAGALNENKYGITSIPGSTTGSKLGTYVKGELAFCVNANSKHKNEAILLLNEFINNQDMGKVLRLARGIPPSKKIREALKLGMTELDKGVFQVQQYAEQAKDTPEPRFIKGWVDVITVVGKETENYAYGKKDLQTTIDDMEKGAEKALADAK